MRRVLAFLEWDVNRWKQRALRVLQRVNDTDLSSSSPENKGPLEEGLRVYALHQASVRQRLFDTFMQQWDDVPAFIALADWGLPDDSEE